MSLSPGTRLGPYEILAAVGAGGMGEVYRAHDSRLHRDVAIKVLPPAFADEPLRRRRFEQEARAIAALNHPHVCHIHDIGSNYLVLEYIDGEPLAGPLPAYDAVRLGIQIASALEAAHRRAILHRDLKPSNILVTRTDEGTASVKLLDFGLARLLTQDDDTRTSDAIIAGTAAYMSPEQAEGKPLDARSDIFGFGAVLYEMLAGRRAFAGASAVHTLAAVAGSEPPDVVAPPVVSDIVRRCLQKQPAQRFQSAADLRTALETALRALAPAAPEPRRQQPSIAVLPFANLSADKENEYFSDGLAEEIINVLAKVPGLTVIARTSAFAFKDRNEDIRRIAEALGVTTVLEGSVRRSGSRLRVTAQLITASDGSHLWSERYDREMIDVFAIQDDIAESIGSALKVKLSLEPAKRGGTTNLAAYEACLRGRYHWAKLTQQSLQHAREFFEEAIRLDPHFAMPHCYLGENYYAMAVGYADSAVDTMLAARSAALEAVRLDPSMAEAHAILGSIAGAYDLDWIASARHFQFAMRHEPVTPHTRVHYGQYLLQTGNLLAAREQYERAVGDDPLNEICRSHLAMCYMSLRMMHQASVELTKSMDVGPGPASTLSLILLRLLEGNSQDVHAIMERVYARAPWLRTSTVTRIFEALMGNDHESATDLMRTAIDQRRTVVPLLCLRVGLFDQNPRRNEIVKALKLPDAR